MPQPGRASGHSSLPNLASGAGGDIDRSGDQLQLKVTPMSPGIPPGKSTTWNRSL